MVGIYYPCYRGFYVGQTNSSSISLKASDMSTLIEKYF